MLKPIKLKKIKEIEDTIFKIQVGMLTLILKWTIDVVHDDTYNSYFV